MNDEKVPMQMSQPATIQGYNYNGSIRRTRIILLSLLMIDMVSKKSKETKIYSLYHSSRF